LVQKIGQVRAVLRVLDNLLHQYESEYHYLFKKVYEQANNENAGVGLQAYYSLPNLARRLLEAFLAFRYPLISGLKDQMDQIGFDAAKKARILRFLHTHSHDAQISEPEHDLSILSETPQILKDIMEVMASEDPRHFEAMAKLVGKGALEEEESLPINEASLTEEPVSPAV
jgi:wobble nucleotide-excising tRNase